MSASTRRWRRHDDTQRAARDLDVAQLVGTLMLPDHRSLLVEEDGVSCDQIAREASDDATAS